MATYFLRFLRICAEGTLPKGVLRVFGAIGRFLCIDDKVLSLSYGNFGYL